MSVCTECVMATVAKHLNLPSRRKIVIWGAALIFAYLLLEGLSWCVVCGIEMTYNVTSHRAQQSCLLTGDVDLSRAESIHPYLGWVHNPQLNDGTALFGHKVPVNSLGFNDIEHGVTKRSPDRVI